MELEDEDLTILCKKFKLRNISDLYAAIEDESVDIMDIKGYLSRKLQQEAEGGECPQQPAAVKEGPVSKSNTAKDKADDYLTIDGKLSNVSYKMARCCNPIYGDEVFGFVSVKEGIKIHRMSCPNAARLIENYPYRIVKVRWKETATTSSFQTTVKIIADDTAAYPAEAATPGSTTCGSRYPYHPTPCWTRSYHRYARPKAYCRRSESQNRTDGRRAHSYKKGLGQQP